MAAASRAPLPFGFGCAAFGWREKPQADGVRGRSLGAIFDLITGLQRRVSPECN
jgi:hypothetical protein